MDQEQIARLLDYAETAQVAIDIVQIGNGETVGVARDDAYFLWSLADWTIYRALTKHRRDVKASRERRKAALAGVI